MQTITTTVHERSTKQGQGKKGPYTSLFITGDKGQKYSGFLNDGDVLPEVGDVINLAVEENGKYLNIKKMEILMSGKDSHGDIASVPGTQEAHKTQVMSSPTSGPTKTELPQMTNKDVSMEVSGLLQALVNTGRYNQPTPEGKIYIAQELLKTHLDLLLQIKRQKASELS